MVSCAYEASFLVLSEDSGDSSQSVLVALAKHLCRVVDDKTQTQRLAFEPVNEQSQRAMRANRWKSRSGQDHAAKVTLRQSIATKLLEGGRPGFVIFHFDGDTTWANRALSANVKKFEKEIRALRRKSGRWISQG
jgi:hypothetical protein